MIIIIIKLRTKTWPNEIGCKKDSVASASSWKQKFLKNILITPKCNWPSSYLQKWGKCIHLHKDVRCGADGKFIFLHVQNCKS